LPPELLKTEEDKKRAQEWADALKLPLAPSEASNLPGGIGGVAPGTGGVGPNDPPALIYSPTAGQKIDGIVVINGRAYSPAFESYRLEVGAGASPSTWGLINQQVIPSLGGPLGAWNTAGLPPGTYTMRLTVQDRQRGPITATVSVTIGDPTTAGPTPTAPRLAP
jgi:hypothetical protein